jgi:hypothetical protein
MAPTGKGKGTGKRATAEGAAPMREVTLRLPAELIEKARARAVAEERPVGWILRKLIATGLER